MTYCTNASSHGLARVLTPYFRSSRDEDGANEGTGNAAWYQVPGIPLAPKRPNFPLYDGVFGECYWSIPLRSTDPGSARLVSYLGDHSERPRRTHLLCGSKLLRRMVEQR